MNKNTYKISDAERETIEYILNHGDRVELIPLKETVKIIKINRDEVKAGETNGNRTENRAKTS